MTALSVHTWSCRGCVCAHVCVGAVQGHSWDVRAAVGAWQQVQPLFGERGGSAGGWAGCGLWEPCPREAAPQMPLFQDKTLQALASKWHHQCKCVCGRALHITHFLPWSRGRAGGPTWAADAEELPQPLHIPGSASSELQLSPWSVLLLSHSRAPCRPPPAPGGHSSPCPS